MEKSYIINLKQLLSVEELKYKTDTILDKDKKFFVPNYQREIRWEKKNILELVNDINVNATTFLGNIILCKHDDYYEVIDGQQRLTIIRMLVKYIYKTYSIPNNITKIEMREFEVESFDEYRVLEDNNYDLFSLSKEKQDQIVKSDKYNQCNRYIELWNYINNINNLKENQDLINFRNKLFDCRFNVIITDIDNRSSSIVYFIDVNQKGIKLDVEDTFKGYLFKKTENNDIFNLWSEYKSNCIAIFDDLKDYDKSNILMLLLEDYLYCYLYKSDDFKALTFKQNFTLSKDFIIKNHTYLSGDHLLRAIGDNVDNIDFFKKLNKISKLLKIIYRNNNSTDDFYRCFNANVEMNRNEVTLIYTLIRNIIKSDNNIPKILVIKYIDEFLINEEIINETDESKKNAIKKNYKSIYPIYILFCLFILASKRKEKNKIYRIVKEKNWISEVNKEIAENIDKIESIKYDVIYKENEIALNESSESNENLEDTNIDSDDELVTKNDYRIRCLTLAALYNFATYKSNDGYTFNDYGEKANKFFNDKNSTTVEHYLVNDSNNSFLNKENKQFIYGVNLKSYTKNIFNFIFVEKTINNKMLNNYLFIEKNNILLQKGNVYEKLTDKYKSIIESNELDDYSQMVVETIDEESQFKKLKGISIDDQKSYTDYFKNDFRDEFSGFQNKIMENVKNHLIKLKENK